LSNEIDTMMTHLKGSFGAVGMGDQWKILTGKAEVEAYDKIKMITQGEGVRAYGVNVSGARPTAHAP
jgi:hypothetical protein